MFSHATGLGEEKQRSLNLLKIEDGEEKNEIPEINFIDHKIEENSTKERY